MGRWPFVVDGSYCSSLDGILDRWCHSSCCYCCSLVGQVCFRPADYESMAAQYGASAGHELDPSSWLAPVRRNRIATLGDGGGEDDQT